LATLLASLFLSFGLVWGPGCDDGEDGDDSEDASADDDPSEEEQDAGYTLPSDARPTKGPWALRMTTTGATIRWETAHEPDQVALRYGPVNGDAMQTVEGSTRTAEVPLGHGVDNRIVWKPDFPGTYFMHEVVLDDLEPGTCYRYQIVGFSEHGGRVCTSYAATNHDETIRVLALGDTSPITGTTQELLEQTLPKEPQFTVHLGDLQYYTTAAETWTIWFEEMAPMLEAGAFMPCIGNHENEKEGQEFEHYYKRFWKGGVAEDGNLYRHHFQTGGVHWFAFNSENDIGPEPEFESQFEWLDQRLGEVAQTEGFRMSIVYFHRPIYTVGDHSPALNLRERLVPILERHDVPLVLQGHNHAYERFEKNGITYLVAGGGGSGLNDIDVTESNHPEDAEFRVTAGMYSHAAMLEIEGSTIHVEIVDPEGQVRDEFDVTTP
jgi:predicted phosphodiesterase